MIQLCPSLHIIGLKLLIDEMGYASPALMP
jgi:hypothetical protein